jgi:hypothetical protein
MALDFLGGTKHWATLISELTLRPHIKTIQLTEWVSIGSHMLPIITITFQEESKLPSSERRH